MGNSALTAGSLIKKGLAALSPSPHAERLVFRRYEGWRLQQAALLGSSVEIPKENKVVLRINPEQLSFAKKKIINKIQTSAPGRFVTFDWGSDLTVLSMTGNTGLLLPAEVTSGLNPYFDTLNTVANPVGTAGAAVGYNPQPAPAISTSVTSNVSTILENAIMDNSSYFELLEMSPKYNTFRALEKMFEMSDADSDVLILELGDMAVYRGFFDDFSFDMMANDPWNWKYRLTFVILANLGEEQERWDAQFNKNNSNISK